MGKLYVSTIRGGFVLKKATSTPEAVKLAKALESRGWRVELEKFDGYKHIDIAITQVKVNIEVDGPQHTNNPKQALADLQRNYYSFKKGYLTLRIPNCLVRTLEGFFWPLIERPQFWLF